MSLTSSIEEDWRKLSVSQLTAKNSWDFQVLLRLIDAQNFCMERLAVQHALPKNRNFHVIYFR